MKTTYRLFDSIAIELTWSKVNHSPIFLLSSSSFDVFSLIIVFSQQVCVYQNGGISLVLLLVKLDK